jgi:hypothetical protein
MGLYYYLLVFIPTKYIITWDLIKEAIGSRPNSDNVEMLHAGFF